MARKKKKVEYKSNWFGIAVFYGVSLLVGAVCVIGWLQGPGSPIGNAAFAGLAAVGAFAVPVCAGQVERHKLMILPALFFACWTAYSVEHANEVLVEAPRKAAFELEQAPALAAVSKANDLLTLANANRQAFTPEKVDCSPCRLTKADAAARDAVRRADLDALITTAEKNLDKAKGELKVYAPAVPREFVLVFGALLDLIVALAIWLLEKSARQNKAEAEKKAEKARAKQPARKAAKQPKIKEPIVTADEEAFLLHARGPRLVVDNR